VKAEHRNQLVDFVPILLLANAFRDPNQVTNLLLLLLELDIGVEHRVVGLTFEKKLKSLDITLMEAIVNALVSFLSMRSGVHVPADGTRVLWGSKSSKTLPSSSSSATHPPAWRWVPTGYK
jgi:hypothetical protein